MAMDFGLEDDYLDNMVIEHMNYIKSPEYKEKKQMEVEEQIEQYIESQIKEYKDRAQQSESLILTWRQKIRERLNELYKSPDWDDGYEEHVLRVQLEQFDKHFNITTLRQGNIETEEE